MFTLNGDPEMCWSANLIATSYSPGSVGMYSTEQEPSLLSLHVILASDGPSMARERPPVPAPSILTNQKLDLTPKIQTFCFYCKYIGFV